ncbi:MAG: Holliday junction resolvase RuvX [Xanthomonadales bacterium]|nr:Holliday junction resolvase RuvX [Xanthomonadales bacterium]
MPATPEPAAQSQPGTVLGFDFGTRLIGVAVGQQLTGGARALGTVPTGDWARLDAMVGDWNPGCLVVGLPLALDGAEQPMSRAARAFAAELERRHGRPVHLIDERHTSAEASRRFAARRAAGSARRKHAAAIDAVAAEIILETWFAEAHPS